MKPNKQSWEAWGAWWLDFTGPRVPRSDGSWDATMKVYGKPIDLSKFKRGKVGTPLVASALPAFNPFDVPADNIVKVDFAKKAAATGTALVGVTVGFAALVGGFYDAEITKVRKLDAIGGLIRREDLGKMEEEQRLIDALLVAALGVLTAPALNPKPETKKEEQPSVPRVRIHGFSRARKRK